MVYLKTAFNSTNQMKRLLSVLRREAKISEESFGRNGIFYTTTLRLCIAKVVSSEMKVPYYMAFFHGIQFNTYGH